MAFVRTSCVFLGLALVFKIFRTFGCSGSYEYTELCYQYTAFLKWNVTEPRGNKPRLFSLLTFNRGS